MDASHVKGLGRRLMMMEEQSEQDGGVLVLTQQQLIGQLLERGLLQQFGGREKAKKEAR